MNLFKGELMEGTRILAVDDNPRRQCLRLVMERLPTNDYLASIPVILFTTWAFEAGSIARFQKPAEDNQLLLAIRNALDLSAPKGEVTVC
jgi:hypothetical protein